MCYTQIGLVCFVAIIAGCASTRAISEPVTDGVFQPQFLGRLDDVDTIEIGELAIAKRSDVKRFIQICRNAHWATYIATMPGDGKTIKFLSGGMERNRLVYAGGWLFDTCGNDAIRFGTIHVDDGDWIDENIDAKLLEIVRSRNML